MISRVTMRQSGLADYLENGKRADSIYMREEKDNAIPLYGSLSVLKKAEEHCIKTKSWTNNYEHITISFSDEDEQILNDLSEIEQGEVLKDISLMMIKHRTSGYDIDNEVIAYAECHDPKIKQEINIRTGILQKRRKHIHIGISYLNPLSDTKLRTTFFNNSYISDTIDKYIAKKHGLTYANATLKKNTLNTTLTKVALERKSLIKELEGIQTQEELITYLENKEIQYKIAKGKNGTYLKVINPHGKNINLRGKDFKHLEILSNNQLNASEKQQHLTELENKSLQELGDILETYYKKYRTPMIDERRNEKTSQVLHDIYAQERPSEEKEVNAFSSFQEKIFYKHYKHLVTTDLKGYFVDTKDSKEVTFRHKEKEITVKDHGDKITANSSTKNLEEKVRLMIDIAQAKGWNLPTLEITGSKAFKKEAHQQIADILREQEQVQEQNKESKTPVVKEIQRVKTPIQYQVKVEQEKREAKELPLSELKQMLEAKRVLAHAVKKYKLDPSNYEITTDNKINNKTNRQKPKNVIDFLQKEISLSSKEAILECQTLYRNQPLDLSSDISNKKEQTTLICINTANNKNTTPQWETVKAKDYIELITLMKTYPYKPTSSQDNKANSNTLLIYTIENKEEYPQLTRQEAKQHFKNKGIDVILLPNTQKSSQSYKVMIPVTQTIKSPMNEETYQMYNKQILKNIGLDKYVNQKPLHEKEHIPSPIIAEPIIIEADNILNVDIYIKQALEARTQEKKIELLKATIKIYTHISNSIEEQALTYIDTEAMMQTSISLLVDTFKNHHQSKKSKYTLIDDTLAHDFKNDITYNPLTYLQIQLKTKDKEILAKALEKITGKEYIKTNHYTVKTALTQALVTATDARALETSILKHFACKECTLENNHIQIGSIKVDFSSIDTNKEKIISQLKGNKERKHSFKAQQKEKSQEPNQNNNRGFTR